MRDSQQENPPSTEVPASREEQAQRAEHDEGNEVERRVEMSQAVAGGGLQHVHAVDIQVLVLGLRDDAGEAVGQPYPFREP